jgi:hypothetical protein
METKEKRKKKYRNETTDLKLKKDFLKGLSGQIRSARDGTVQIGFYPKEQSKRGVFPSETQNLVFQVTSCFLKKF